MERVLLQHLAADETNQLACWAPKSNYRFQMEERAAVGVELRDCADTTKMEIPATAAAICGREVALADSRSQ